MPGVKYPIDGDKLRLRRAERGLNQKELAKEAGVSERLIRDIETGKNDSAMPVKVVRLARALNTDIYDLSLKPFEPHPHRENNSEES